jgi:hypothetical protein
MMLAAAATGAVLLASCSKPHQPAPAPASPAPHWLYSARLQELMMELQVTTEKTWPAPTEETDASLSDDARQAALDEACALAAALESAAQSMPAAARRALLSKSDMESFLAQAGELEDQAQQLEQAGLDRDVVRMRTILDQVNVTCATCHRRFRDLAGPLP